ncbi:hypothetical protein J437_LFUL000355, partial [Ladona fulva]
PQIRKDRGKGRGFPPAVVFPTIRTRFDFIPQPISIREGRPSKRVLGGSTTNNWNQRRIFSHRATSRSSSQVMRFHPKLRPKPKPGALAWGPSCLEDEVSKHPAMSILLVRTVVAVALLSVFCDANRLYFPATNELFEALMGGGNYNYPVADEPANGMNGGGPAVEQQQQQLESTPTIKEPSKCVWAILGCCNPGSERVNIACFEEKGCHGNFFDRSPCRRESAANAHRIMMRYQAMKDAMKREEMASMVQEGPEPTPYSPFAPVGPLPSREEAGIPY